MERLEAGCTSTEREYLLVVIFLKEQLDNRTALRIDEGPKVLLGAGVLWL